MSAKHQGASVTDPMRVDFSDPMQVGLFVTKMQGEIGQMTLATANAQQNISSAMQSLQVEVAEIARNMRELSSLGQSQAANTDSIRRIWERIEKNEERYASTRDRVNRIVFIGVGAMAVLSIGSAIVYDMIKDSRNADRAQMQESARRINSNDDRLDKLEVFLAGDKDRPFQR